MFILKIIAILFAINISVYLFFCYKRNKYRFSTKQKPISFTDLNFKLLVIEELMYRQKILKPIFNIDQYAKKKIVREIDLEDETLIYEALVYFKDLVIEERYIEKIRSLCADDGNEIYQHIFPYWSGEGDIFKVISYNDVEHFPQLRNINYFNGNEYQKKYLESKNIYVN